MASELTVGVIGGGHAGTALAAWFSSQKVQTAMWAPANHPGSLPSIRQHGGILASGLIEAKFLILATRADVHQAFVQDLEKFVLKKPLLVICGHGFTVNYAARLMCERILETDDSPVTAKLIGGQGNEVHIKAILPSFGVSCYPVTRDGGGNLKLPKSISETLAKIFGSSITAISPLHSLFFSNYIIHAVSATLNIGRLRDPEGSLTERAEGWRTELESRVGADYRFYFYGQGTNSYVCAVIDAADKERLKVAGALGIKLDTVLAECNTQSKTDYVNMREFSLAPFPYNVNFACPDTLQHRYFSEEIRTMEMICAIAKSHRIKIPVTKSIMSLIKAARGDDVDALSLMGGLPFDPTKLSIFGARTV